MNIKLSTTISSLSTKKVINLLNGNLVAIKNITEGIEPAFLETRKEQNSWSAVEILAHLHACATIWGDTIDEILKIDSPMIDYLHPGEWHDLSNFSNMSFTQSYEIYIQKRSKLLSRLVSLHLDEWGRIGVIKGKKHTVYSQARRMALHEFSHLEQISTSFKSTE